MSRPLTRRASCCARAVGRADGWTGCSRCAPSARCEALLDAARAEWFALTPADWLEAFAAHPRIGDLSSLRERFAGTRHLAAHEQSGVDDAPEDVLVALAEGNAAYEQRFGHIFIVCATGLTAGEMLARLRARLTNDPETELGVAAVEQARITELRLTKLATSNFNSNFKG